MTRRVAAALLALVLATAACEASPTGSSAPTLEPSVESAQPSPDDTPTAPATTTYEAFLTRLLAGNEEIVVRYDALVEALSSDQPGVELRLAAIEMSDWADQERSWLLSHEPAECYEGAWEAWLQTVEAYGTLGDLAAESAADPLNRLLEQTAIAAIEDATDAHVAASGALDLVTC